MKMKEDTVAACGIHQVTNPELFYGQHANELALVGADAFGQPVTLFAPQVEERFAKSSLAQIMHDGPRIVGFALYDIIRGRHWQFAVD